MQYPNVRNILIIKLRSIGDVILATPVIENLRKAYPHATIDFLTERPCYPIIKNHPDLNDVVVFNRTYIQNLSWHKSLRKNLDFFKKLRGKKYDLVFDLFGNPRSALFALATGAKHRIGFAFRGRKYAYNKIVQPRGDKVHEVLFNLDALEKIGIPIKSTELFVEVDDVNAAYVESYWQEKGLDSRTVVGINASGGWYTKRWPLQSFAKLADWLIDKHQVEILLLWGPAERQDAETIAKMMQRKAVLAPQSDLNKLAAILSRVDLLVSNDSGPMHLAAAVGTPVVGVYGPTRPELQGPWGEIHTIVRNDGLDCLGCNGVICKIKSHDCMQNLEVKTVFAKVNQALETISPVKAID
ncbi:MAG: lipopolysaccharide heptosyltransferase II [bacterium]